MTNEIENEFDDSCEYIAPNPRLTRFDKCRIKLSELEQARDLIQPLEDLSASDRQRLLIINKQIELAQAAFKKEADRATDDIYRLRHSIDEWRSGIGKEVYNSSRRAVREAANANLEGYSVAQKARHVQDQKNDSKWRQARRKAGMSETEIKAAFQVRLQEREKARTQDNLDNPKFGIF